MAKKEFSRSLVQKVEFIIAWGQDPGRQKELPPVGQ